MLACEAEQGGDLVDGGGRGSCPGQGLWAASEKTSSGRAGKSLMEHLPEPL